MPRNPLNESEYFQFEQYLNSNFCREYNPYVRKTVPIASDSHRLNPRNKSTVTVFDQLNNNQRDSLTLNRRAYKLRIKSDLNIDTLKEIHLPHHRYYHRIPNHTNSNINQSFNTIPLAERTKALTQQPPPIIMTTNSKKTIVNDQFNGIEGNAMRVEKLDDQIKQFNNTESRLFYRPPEYLDNSSTSISNNRSTNEHTLSKKSQSFLIERAIKKPQIRTEHQFNTPTLLRTTSQAHRYRIKQRINHIDQYLQRFNSFEQQSSIMNFRERSMIQSGKQVYVCNKLNINDSMKSEQTETVLPLCKQPSARFIFPFTRPLGYFSSKSTNDLPRLTPIPIKKKEQKIIKDPFEQSLIYEDGNSQFFNNTIKSIISCTDLDDDLRNPPNTCINVDLEQDKQ